MDREGWLAAWVKLTTAGTGGTGRGAVARRIWQAGPCQTTCDALESKARHEATIVALAEPLRGKAFAPVFTFASGTFTVQIRKPACVEAC